MSEVVAGTGAPSRRRGLWGRLAVSVRLSTDVCGGQLYLSSTLKQPVRIQRAAAVGGGLPRTGTTSAAASNPDVQELRRKLRGHAALVVKWEEAGETVTDELLWRWIKAKGGVVEAEQALVTHAQWRIELGRISKADIQNELAAEKVFLQGCDLRGRPVLVVLGARHIIRQRDLDETKRLITYALEAAICGADTSKNPLGQILCLFDLSGIGLGNLDAKALQAVFEVLQQHFPESLSELWFLNTPMLFYGLWKVVSPFIQPATKDKITFLSGRTRGAVLAENVSPQVLPACYGGEADLVRIEDAALLARQKSQAVSRQARASSANNGQGRLAGFKRVSGQAAVNGWHFVRDHNPVWAARVFGGGVKRVSLAIPRPNWNRGRPTLKRHASAVSVHVRNAWKHRPPMPRPHYRFRPRRGRPVESSVHMNYVDVALFYIIAVILAFVAIHKFPPLFKEWASTAPLRQNSAFGSSGDQ